MAKKAASIPTVVIKAPRGRPPRVGGRKPQTEIQREYRARLKAVGKIVRLIDADDLSERETVLCLHDKLHNALLKLELREQDVVRLTARNAYLEGEMKREERHHTNALKENIVLKQEAAALSTRTRRRSKSGPG
jgi:hypothetical protein